MKGSSFQLVAQSLIVAPPLSPPLLILGNPHWVQVDGNLSHSLLEKGDEVLFAFEEAIGFMFGTRVLDKDGVSGAAVTGEMAAYLYSHGQTFSSTPGRDLFKIWSSCLKQFLFYMSLERNHKRTL